MRLSSYLTASDLKSLRAQNHLTQQELAAELGVPAATYAQWETGRYRLPPLLPGALKPALYRVVIRRNQPILDRCAVTLEQYMHEVDRLGLRGERHDLPMFDAHDELIYWWLPRDARVFALGENQNGSRYFVVPTSISPRPELRLPDYHEQGWQPFR